MSEHQFDEDNRNALALEKIENPPPAVRSEQEYREITPAQARVESVAAVLDSAYRAASTLKLTEQEAAELTADFPDEAFELGAGGDKNLIYLSHVYLRQRLNKVLGIGAVVPIRRREWSEEFTYMKDNRQKKAARVYVDLVLIVRGCVVGEAIGDAIFYMENANDSYSDTLEKAKSNAFRRCCKEFGVGLQPWMKGWCDQWKQRNRGGGHQPRQFNQAPPQYQRPPQNAPRSTQDNREWAEPPAGWTPPQTSPQANVERKPASSGDVLPKMATEARRTQVVEYLNKQFDAESLEGFFEDKGWVAEWPLTAVPATNQALSILVNEINEFIASRQCPPSDGVSENLDTESDLPPEIANSIITVPRRGSKRDEYLQNPDTIGSLYRAMKSGDNEAQKRLWGLVKGWQPEPYVAGNGKKYPVSQEDSQCRIDLDVFADWYSSKHGEGNV